jgi:magnesium-transporting ATPase (P-type)
MRRGSIELSRRHEWCVYVVVAAVFLTGAAWAMFHYGAGSPNEFGPSSSAEALLLKAHGAAAMVVLVLLGTLLPLHMKFAWRARRNLRSGLTMLGLLLFLILTGYALYYAGGERLRAWTAAAHLWVGLALPPIVASHVWRGRKTQSGRRPPAEIALQEACKGGEACQAEASGADGFLSRSTGRDRAPEANR